MFKNSLEIFYCPSKNRQAILPLPNAYVRFTWKLRKKSKKSFHINDQNNCDHESRDDVIS